MNLYSKYWKAFLPILIFVHASGIASGSLLEFQSGSKVVVSKDVRISGIILNPKSSSISFSYISDRLKYETKEVSANIDKEGKFNVSFPASAILTLVTIVHGNQKTELIIEPGFSVTIMVDATNFDKTLKYSGKDSAVANFMASHVLLIGVNSDFPKAFNGLYVKNPEEYIASLKELQNKEMDFLEQHGRYLSKPFKEYWKANFKYLVYCGMLKYVHFHEMYAKISNPDSSTVLREYEVPKHVPAEFNDDYLDQLGYRNYLNLYYRWHLISNGYNPSPDKLKLEDSIKNLANANMPLMTKEYYLAYKLFSGMDIFPLEHSLKDYAEYKNSFSSSEYISAIDGKIGIRIHQSMGQDAPDFTLKSIDDKDVRLSELKGKMVFIDFWASWCAPCIAEIPFIKSLEEHYRNRDIVFVSISSDADNKKWKDAISKYKLDGVHLKDEGGSMDGKVVKLYGVTGIPAHFLIDKSGKYFKGDLPAISETNQWISVIDQLLK